MSAFDLWWDKVGASIGGVCKEDARHGWDAAIEIVEELKSSHNKQSTPCQKPCDCCGELLDPVYYCSSCDNDE